MHRATAVFLLALFPAQGLAQEAHVIRMDRFPKVGQTLEVNSQFEQSFEGKGIFKGGGITQTASRSVSMTIRISVDEANQAGQATRATYHIVNYKGTNNHGAIKGKLGDFMIGKKVEVSMHEGQRRYGERLADKSVALLDDAWTNMLDLAVPLRFMNEPGYDEVFGTTEPQKSGASWPVPAERVVEFYKQYGVTKDRIKASATLKSARKSGEHEMLTVDIKLNMSGLTYGMPADWKQTDDKYEWSMTTTVSTDPQAFPTEQSVRRYQSISGAAKGKKATEWSLQTVKAKYKLVQ